MKKYIKPMLKRYLLNVEDIMLASTINGDNFGYNEDFLPLYE